MQDKKLSFSEFVEIVERDFHKYMPSDIDKSDYIVEIGEKRDDYGIASTVLTFQMRDEPVERLPSISLDAAYENYKKIGSADKIINAIVESCRNMYRKTLLYENRVRSIEDNPRNNELAWDTTVIPGNKELGITHINLVKKVSGVEWDKYERKLRKEFADESCDDFALLPINEDSAIVFNIDSSEVLKNLKDAKQMMEDNGFDFYIDDMRLYNKNESRIVVGIEDIIQNITDKEQRRKSVFNVGK